MRKSLNSKLTRAMIMTLCAAMLVIVCIFGIGLLVVRHNVLNKEKKLGNSISESGQEMISAQAVALAEKATNSGTDIINATFEQYVNSITMLAGVATNSYTEYHDAEYIPGAEEIPNKNGKWRLYCAACDEDSEYNDSLYDAEALAFMDSFMEEVHNSYSDIASVYFVMDSGMSVYFDSLYAQKAEKKYYDSRTMSWYKSAKKDGKTVISNVYDDPFDNDSIITIAVPFYDGDTFKGVFAVNIYTATVEKDVAAVKVSDNGIAMLITKSAGMVTVSGAVNNETNVMKVLGDDKSAYKQISEKQGGRIQSKIDGEDVFIIWAEVSETSWKFVSILPFSDVNVLASEAKDAAQASLIASQSDLSRFLSIIMVVVMLLFIAILILTIFLVNRQCGELIEPLNKLNKEVKEAAKDTNVEYKSQIRTGDEIEELSKTFEDTMRTLAMQVNNVQYAMKKSDKAAQERIAFEEKSKTDPLTGLYNRQGFTDSVNACLRENNNQLSAYIMVDQDNFKGINDKYGHMTGDDVLKRTALILKKVFRSTDIIARVGGDEFSAFVLNIESKAILAQRLDEFERLIKEEYLHGDDIVMTSCSIGAAIYPYCGQDFEELYASADESCYAAKKAGKGCYRIHETIHPDSELPYYFSVK